MYLTTSTTRTGKAPLQSALAKSIAGDNVMEPGFSCETVLVGPEFLRFKERVTVIEERAIKFLYLGEESFKQSFMFLMRMRRWVFT